MRPPCCSQAHVSRVQKKKSFEIMMQTGLLRGATIHCEKGYDGGASAMELRRKPRECGRTLFSMQSIRAAARCLPEEPCACSETRAHTILSPAECSVWSGLHNSTGQLASERCSSATGSWWWVGGGWSHMLGKQRLFIARRHIHT